MVDPVNLPPFMRDDSMVSVDEIAVLSYLKDAEAVVGRNINKGKK